MVTSRKVISLLAVLGMAVLLPACGSGGGSAASTSTAASSPTVTPSTADATSSSAPTSIADWEALWKKQRDAVVKRIKDNGWGKSADGTKITGPEGFSVDLTKCPAGWSDTEGLTDTSIKIGFPVSLSGPAGGA